MKSIFFVFLLCLSFSLCAQEKSEEGKWGKEYHEDPVCIIKTSMGDIYVELFEKEAPVTVKKFH